MLQGLFTDNTAEKGAHMNAYVKTAQEPHLTHWEPRKGPQRFFNDTICAAVTSTATSLFEKGVREGEILTSGQATQKILRNPELKTIFDELLHRTKARILHLVADVKKLFGNSGQHAMKEQVSKLRNQVATDDEPDKHPGAKPKST